MISVVMPAYNCDGWVGEAIESILNQTWSDFELIVANDGSTDCTAAVVRSLAERDARVRFFDLKHAGHGATANFCVRAARGAYIARMDHDDVAVRDRLQNQLDWIRIHGLDGCGGWAKHFGNGSGAFWAPEGQDAICREHLFRVSMLHSTFMARAEVVLSIPYREDITLEDYHFFLEALTRYRVNNMPKFLIKRRLHAQQLSREREEASRRDIQALRPQLFERLHPEAGSEDRLGLRTLWNEEPCSSLAELRCQGRWLESWAALEAGYFQEVMAKRWYATCKRSKLLGSACLDCYQERPLLCSGERGQKLLETIVSTY
jgi:glycosyltransferase involved in cell wall biosynthesis